MEIPFVMPALWNRHSLYQHLKTHLQQGNIFHSLAYGLRTIPPSRRCETRRYHLSKLFTACLESVFQTLNWDNKGFNIDDEYLNHLRFADDIILLSGEPQQLQNMLTELNEASVKVGLQMNLKKKPKLCIQPNT